MDRIPEDVIIIIASFLPSGGLAPFATLSRPWQRAIERRAFSALRIDITTNDLHVFERSVWTDYMRRRFLKDLTFVIQLYVDMKKVTRDLRRLFLILAESDDEKKMTLTLELFGNIRDEDKDKDEEAQGVRRGDQHGLADAPVEANFLSGTECQNVSLSLLCTDIRAFDRDDLWVPDRTNSLSYDPLGAAATSAASLTARFSGRAKANSQRCLSHPGLA
ncbi:hypothetical protein F4813DRAFT_396073 [Daldinia decipiens]|uniref:uncharacterized protein n=1 Tax=Daldinia decipiens TaxID=326647 RepID=UPI0020C52661|nr:uncharacterized protein F4813DRAFT_396073 [Daldinia decipiens]KAI1657925.1 hypothetical protein F4813DRAFT_396073 [Daldinia decipiens]